MEERISVDEIIKLYGVDISFLNELEEADLIKTEIIDEIRCLHYDQLSDFEHFTNWHYDLGVNIAGLEVIRHLLRQINSLQEENKQLMNRI